jgi:glycosidase
MDKDSIIYHIFLDRFAGFNPSLDDQKPQWVGGNFKAATERLQYIKSLGVTWILLSPFLKGVSYHGYHTTDFGEVDSHLGTKGDLENFVRSAHKLGIKVMMDYVPNHCSDQHPFFVDAVSNKQSSFKDWFIFDRWPNKYQNFLGYNFLPKLNLSNVETGDYIISNINYWVREFGFDGIRLDHVIGPSHEFWKKFCAEVRKECPGIIIIGEVWFKGISFKDFKSINAKSVRWNYFLSVIQSWSIDPDNVFLTDKTMRSYVGIFDGCLDFSFNKLIRNYVIEQSISSAQFQSALNWHYSKFPHTFLLPTFVDNHDMDRFFFGVSGSLEKLRIALDIQADILEPKVVYYGSEIGLKQNQTILKRDHGDLEVRRKMEWDENSQNGSVLNIYKETLLRKSV